MANVVVAYIFQIISFIFIIVTLLPQAFLNYRLKNIVNYSILTIILVQDYLFSVK